MNNVLFDKLRWCLLIAGICFIAMVGPSWAADSGTQWRPVYDLVMRWINFGILLFLLVRYGGPPLRNFLKNQKDDIQNRMEQVQRQKDEMLNNVLQAQNALRESASRIDEIRNRIIEMGEHQKEEIIEDAKAQSKLMIESARHRIDYQIHAAQERLKLELLDMAMASALEKLPGEITPEDDRKLIDKYLKATVSVN